MPESRPMTMLLLGGAIHNANRGVGALGSASLMNLRRVFPQARLIVANSGLGTNVQVRAGAETFRVETSWISPSRVLRHRGGTRHLNALRRLRRWVPGYLHRLISNRTFEQLQDADVVLDICGGDSFAEIYGQQRFQSQVAVKQLVLTMHKPLVLLPQTFGPFTSAQARGTARRIVRDSLLVATRDLGGSERLERLAGADVRPRLASCPDVAFALQPTALEPGQLPSLLRRPREGPIIGLNVSGWLHTGHAHIALGADYREVISAIIQWAMSIPRARLLLVPHVFGPHRPEAAPERDTSFDSSDLEACRIVQEQWAARFGERIGHVQRPLGPGELKYIIGRCNFFIGARMHSCIAAASQEIPTVVLAYSRKAEGVFGMIGADSMVVDMRCSTVTDVIERIKDLYRRRDGLERVLRMHVPAAKEAVREFFAERLRSVLVGREDRRGTHLIESGSSPGAYPHLAPAGSPRSDQ